MKLIIDIPEDFYKTLKTTLSYGFNYLEDKVRQATPLSDELEKLRSELHETAEMHIDGDYYLRDAWIDEYIDKYIDEREET